MYEKDGEKYFIVDEHQHFWNARPDNWVEGRENLAKGWIDCFYGYHQLGPPETHWPLEKYQRWTLEDYGRDVFEEGHVDYAVLQSTFLYYWYKEGFNTTKRNQTVAEAFPGKVIVNGRWDPREGEEGLRRFEENHKRDNYKGVKLYTAEWYGNSRGYKVSDPEAYRYLDKTRELGIKNVHLHKGPTIWPLDRDAFDVEDVDKAATDFPELNFIVEHAGVPRIEQFAYIAVQEPNVYAGLSVVIGAHMHARPNTFARFMGELLFWVGEDRIVFGSDYGIWEPKWQVEGFIDWQMPDSDQFSDYPKLTTTAKKKIMGLNAAKLYDIEVPAEFQIPAPGTTADEKAPGEELLSRGSRGGAGVILRDAVWAALGTVRDPELDEPITELEFVSSCTVSPDGVATVLLRLPTFFCAANFSWLMVADAYDAVSAVPGVARADIELEGHFVAEEINEGVAARSGFAAAFSGEARAELDELRRTFNRKAALAGQDIVARPLVDAGATPEQLAALRLGQVPPSPELTRMRERRVDGGLPHDDDAPLLLHEEGTSVTPEQVPLHLRRARLTRVSIEGNSGTCRDLLAKRYAATS